MKIRQIETEFVYDGFETKQLARDGAIAIYSRTKYGLITYETILIQTGPPYTAFSADQDSEWDLVETYPRANSWGTLGWTYKTRDGAEERMAQLIRARKLCRTPGKVRMRG
jgi:hypothetical protein